MCGCFWSAIRKPRSSWSSGWLRDRLPAATAGSLYRKLDETLVPIGFVENVREICRPDFRDCSAGGRPRIDPAVYFKMLAVERLRLIDAL